MLFDIISTFVLEPAALPIMAASAGTALYPVKGIGYFLRTPLLWGNLLMMALPQAVLTFIVFSLVYIFLYPPQAAIALLFNGPTGVLTAWIGMLQQAVAFTQIISSILLMPTPLRLMFDTILTNEGQDSLVSKGRNGREDQISDHSRVINFIKSIPRKLVLPKWFFKFIFRVSVNFIPVLGPIILIICDASGTGTRCLGRYFALKGLDKDQVYHHVKSRKGEFFAFGLIAAALEALPFIGIIFMFTNTCGGALWALDSERQSQSKQSKKSRLGYLFD